MKIIAVRHGPFSPTKGGNPTTKASEMFPSQSLGTLTSPKIFCSNTPRTIIPATSICKNFGTKPSVLSEFNPLITAKFPSLFGGWLYELIHRWQILNWLILVLWWGGLPIFTEKPVQLLNRTRDGLKILQNQNAKEVLLICHQETIVALRIIINGQRPFHALKRRIKHFSVFNFEV